MQPLIHRLLSFCSDDIYAKKNIPWFGLAAIVLMIQGLGYLGVNAVLFTDAVLGNCANLQIVFLPILMVLLPIWQAIAGITTYPLLVLLGMPFLAALLFYYEGARHDI